jgi:hypothetical protein
MRGKGTSAAPSLQGATWYGTTVPPAPQRVAPRGLGLLFRGTCLNRVLCSRPERAPCTAGGSGLAPTSWGWHCVAACALTWCQSCPRHIAGRAGRQRVPGGDGGAAPHRGRAAAQALAGRRPLRQLGTHSLQ